MIATVTSVADVREALLGAERVLPVAGGTKPALSRSGDDGVLALDLGALSGITAYDPAELTVTVRAGTTIEEIEAELNAHGQFLPFDPLLRRAGATIGGTVAAGIGGPGACGGGTIRDFVIGTTVVDGRGRVISGGGRVVKNAAGFDLPKLLVGSAGRLGVIAELCLKVFPRPQAASTVVFECESIGAALREAIGLTRGTVSLDAIELAPPGRLFARLVGRAEGLAARVERLGGEALADHRAIEEGESPWRGLAELDWVPADSRLVAIGTTMADVGRLDSRLEPFGARRHFSLGTGVALVAWEDEVDLLGELLGRLGLTGIALTGVPAEPPLIGAKADAFGERIRATLDPEGRFLGVWG